MVSPNGTNSKPGPSADEVRQELERILQSVVFRSSFRCRSFLTFVVDRALNGEADRLRERTLAVEVFGRQAGADMTEDSIVRVGARELRKRLAQYYREGGGNDPVRIELPAGTYAPVFREYVPPPDPSPEDARKPSRSLWFDLALALLMVALVAVGWAALRHGQTEFEAFWRPALTPGAPVLLGLAHQLPGDPAIDDRDGARRRARESLPTVLEGLDPAPVFDRSVGFGDTLAAVQLARMLHDRSREVRIRLASELEFNDLRDASSVLIGAFTNRWTDEITRGFRFHFDRTGGGQPTLVDSTNSGRLTARAREDGSPVEDHILICRLPHAPTGRLVLVVSALTQYGNQEAGRILSQPEALMTLLRQLPSDWEQRNLEMVLHSQSAGDTAAAPELEAWQTW